MEKFAVIVAGGSGTRMGGDLPKQFMLLKDKPVLWYTLVTFLESFPDLKIILVLPAAFAEEGRSIALTTPDPERISIVNGGPTRFQSVKNGLVPVTDNSIVFVHDGVRCLITSQLIQRCYQGALDYGNAIPAVTATDSIRIEDADGNQVMDRSKVRIVQTPQTFSSTILKAAFEVGYHESFTDEASVAELAGSKIHLVEGELTNLKITRPIDLIVAERILEERTFGK